MKARFLLLFAGLMIPAIRSGAQSFSIRGQVADTINQLNLPNASVTLLRAGDSVLETFSRTNTSGNFELHPKKPGDYLMMITFPKFVDYVDVIKVTDKDVNTGLIPMISKTNLLKEFVVKQNAAIRIKGDTTEYMADSFKVREGATVEELLKKLPGIQVDKNGQVSAQGEKVQKILVDGEEFFTDDPAVVTKGLQAKTVEKVQVFDKKSDQAEFTGIDDGEKIKTLNLQLKDNAKKGYFGKLDLGGGTDQYFQNQGMINAFKGKRKLTAFGIVSNTDKVGLGWEDRNKFGDGNDGSVVMGDDGSVTSFSNSNNDEFSSWDGTYNGQGLPKVWTGGVHYSDKWGDKDKYHVSSNYRYAKQNLETEGNTLTEYSLPGSRNVTNEKRSQFSTGQRHAVDGLYEWQIDSTSSIKLTANGGYKQTQASNRYLSSSVNNEDDTLYNGIRTINSDASSKNVNANLLYRKKFAKKGRTLSANVSEAYQESESDGYIYALTHFYQSAKDSLLDQHKVNNNKNLTVNGKLTYTEPLSKVAFLELNYALSVNNTTAEKSSFDRNQSGEFTDSLNQMYSSNYRFDIMQNSGGANMRFNYKKYNFSFGGNVSNTSYNQENLATDTVYHRSYQTTYLNFFPQANFNYKISKQSSLRFNYNGSTRQPTIDQVQPLRDNTNPNNTPIGNPDLRQEFRNRIGLNYNSWKTLANRYLWSGISFTTVDNAISRSDMINADGSRSYQYINVSGNYNAYGYGGYSFKLMKLNLTLGCNVNVGINHSNGLVNGQKNVSDNNSYGFTLDMGYDLRGKKDEDPNRLGVSFRPGISYNNNKSSISTYTTSYWTSENEFNIYYRFPYKIEVNTSANWFIREKTQVFPTNNNVLRWDAYVSKKMLKGDQMEVRLSVFDILNQNVGFSRYANGNMVNQDSYNTIRRYGLLSVIWNFTHTPAGNAQQENSSFIIN